MGYLWRWYGPSVGAEFTVIPTIGTRLPRINPERVALDGTAPDESLQRRDRL